MNRKPTKKVRAPAVASLLLLLFFSQLSASSVLSIKPNRMLAITHVTIVGVVDGSLKTDSDVLISGDRISAINAGGTIAVPEDDVVIDATGLYLIPGLWDMHVHTLREDRIGYFPVFVANGILGVRDMGSPLVDLVNIRTWRRDTADGTMLGPRIIAAGPLLDGPKPMFPEISLAVDNEAEARRAVDYLVLEGVDFLKVYSLLPRDAYRGIAEESKRLGVPFAGHVPDSMGPGEAAEAGQKSIEHLTGVWRACSRNRPATTTRLARARKGGPRLRTGSAGDDEEFDPAAAGALFSTFVAKKTWQVPTLSTFWGFSQSRIDRFGAFPEAYDGPCAEAIGVQSVDQAKARAIKGSNSWSVAFQRAFILVGSMRAAGVQFMAGTDAPNPFTPAGSSLHLELQLFVKVGFTNLEALQTATINPAEYLGMSDQIGTVEEGKSADLVLLRSNPLDDIRNTRDIEAVIEGGRLISKSTLERLVVSSPEAVK